jgi:hypothetical protein
MVEFKALGGFWVAVKIDEVSGGTLQMHVAVSVGSRNDLTAAELGVEVWSGDLALALAQAPTQLAFMETRAITAVAPFVFADSDNLNATVVRVSLRGESEVWDVSGQTPGEPIVG